MYKLTYESEDDILDDNTDNLTKKLDNEIIIYDKEEKQHTWTTDSQNNERRSTMPSATSAAISIHNSRKSSMEKKKNDGNFYSLFSNNFPVETSKKTKEPRSPSNCEYFLLVFYLVALTASVVVLFFYVKRVEDENSALRQHILELNHARSFSDRKTPVAIKQHRKKQSCSDRSCYSTKQSWLEMRTKLSRTSDSLGNLQQVSQQHFDDTARQLFKLEQRIENVSNYLIADVKQLNGNQPMEIFESVSKALQSNLSANKQGVAFDVQRAVTDQVDTHQSDKLNEIAFFRRNQLVLRFSHTLINFGKGFNEDTGIFTAPVDGIYVFLIQFCTNTRMSESVTVQLQKNKAAAKTFRAPIVSGRSVTYLLSVAFPPLRLLDEKSTNIGELKRHHHTGILNLNKGDKIQLVVTEGAIVELDSRNGMESESCSEFSGFLIN